VVVDRERADGILVDKPSEYVEIYSLLYPPTGSVSVRDGSLEQQSLSPLSVAASHCQ